MANDDYDVVVFKILTYLYGCMKRKYSFDIHAFNAVISKQNVSDEYLSDMLFMATDEGLVLPKHRKQQYYYKNPHLQTGVN